MVWRWRWRHAPFVIGVVAVALCSGAVSGCVSSSSGTTTPSTHALGTALVEPDCPTATPIEPPTTLTTDLAADDPRLAAMRCVIGVVQRSMAGRVPDMGVIAGSTVDALGELAAIAAPGRSAVEVAGHMTTTESAMYTRPLSVMVNLARIRADSFAAPSEGWSVQNDLAHDLYHTVQVTLLGGGAPASAAKLDLEPVWLQEAAAEWFSEHLLATEGYPDAPAFVAAASAQRAAGFPGLADWTTWTGMGSLHAPTTRMPTALRFGMVAEIGQLLVDRAGEDALLFDYWSARASTDEPWSTTFARVFGIGADEFATQVAAHFADVAARTTITTTIPR